MIFILHGKKGFNVCNRKWWLDDPLHYSTTIHMVHDLFFIHHASLWWWYAIMLTISSSDLWSLLNKIFMNDDGFLTLCTSFMIPIYQGLLKRPFYFLLMAYIFCFKHTFYILKLHNCCFQIIYYIISIIYLLSNL